MTALVLACVGAFISTAVSSAVWTWNNHSVALLARRATVISDGCIITDAQVETAVIGVRSIIETGTTIRETVIMGADYYAGAAGTDPNRPAPGIGRNCRIERVIIDKNVHIGDNVVITPEGKPDNMDNELFYIRDGIVVIPKDTVIPAGTWI